MSEFTFLFRGRDSDVSPEKMRRYYEKWVEWFKKLNADGVIRNAGQPLEMTGKVVAGPGRAVSSVTDGPYAEKDLVRGFTVVEAADIDAAVALAGGCPILDNGGLVEVRPVLRMTPPQ